jgi:hypothetical protein
MCLRLQCGLSIYVPKTAMWVNNPVWDNTGYRGFDAGGRMKSPSLLYWLSPNTGANNASGFDARGAGMRTEINLGSFTFLQQSTSFFSSTLSGNLISTRLLISNSQQISRQLAPDGYGRSVRCIRN